MNDPLQKENDLEREIFTEALKCESPEKRAIFLHGACINNPTRRVAIEALLRYHKEDEFMQASGTAVTPFRAMEDTGDRIGRYKLLEKVGEGGCGVVYVAEQVEPVRRRVALKVIKLGMDTKQVIARFEAERQALALMDHPNIAKVLDAGTTSRGRPYFVMELVRGIRITDYCDQANLSMNERLDLFIKVCQAIQHAHQKGIIHRDVKPSNIMVTLHDGVPVPKVIDFGIAKATDGRLTEATVYTELHQFIGTPAYMSPEQAEMSGLDIDTRSDIYSLGVLLYELLAGSTPFDASELIAGGLEEMRRTIREKEPVRPSTKVGTLQGVELTTTARRRSIDTTRLAHLLRGDLDWIVMKCLEKDRTRRYETANSLAADLKRHLQNEPVEARPPSTTYRLQKAWRRHKTVFAATAVMLAVLIAATGISAWQAIRATHAETLAQQRLAEAEAISEFLAQVLASPDPARDGRTITVAETLGAAATRLETDLANQPERRAKLQATLGITYDGLGLHREAVPLQEEALAYYRKSAGPQDPNTLMAMQGLAISYNMVGRQKEALKLREEVVPLRRKVNGPEDSETLKAMQELAFSYDEADRPNEALKLREQVLPISRKVNGAEDPDTLEAMQCLAFSYAATGHQAEALKLRQEVVPLRRKVSGPEHPDTIWAMHGLANSCDAVGRHGEAIQLLEQLLLLSRKVNGPEHPNTLWVVDDLAKDYEAAGRHDEAIALGEQLYAIDLRIAGPANPDTLQAMNSLAAAYAGAGRTQEANALREQASKIDAKENAPAHPDARSIRAK